MEKILSIIAILVSMLAFIFGGYFSSAWNKEVTKADLSVLVRDIRYEYPQANDAEIRISADLQARSSKAKYFPTLEGFVSKERFSELLEEIRNIESSALEMQYALDQLDRDNSDDSDAQRVWDDLSAESKASLLSIRTKRIIFSARHLTSDLNLGEFVDQHLEQDEHVEVDDEYLSTPGVRESLRGSLMIAARLETNATKELVLTTIKEDISGLKLAASEFSSFKSDVEAALNLEDEVSNSVIWKFEVTIFNAGGVPSSLLPIGSAAIQKPADGNIVLNLRPNSVSKLIIAPGEALNLTLSSVDVNDPISKSLLDMFVSGDRDFVVVLAEVSGEYVESIKYNFSDEIDDETKRRLVEFSKKSSI
ncbi:hypothetical protein [Alteromonas sp. KUL49]|uniref:hypothetical protein n=1 Tax=Alteromonas sp. KUL49 TaxID=2480798 RepID=UPI00102EDB98|nr:hypothetical protein [Alteromonas sp. KUL49]TAP41308.1 hypothetical protein EYS00_03700 [Alteromonas sp. KUL49]GEA10368.1 hypothetical protein KUL49_07430 [Alteromonas sp. KUL49]